MLQCLANIIEGMGFIKVDGFYTAKFLSKPTGNLITIIVDDLCDDPDDSAMVRFNAFDVMGDLLSCQTLDQIIVACDTELELVKYNWDEKYYVYFDVKFEVPVDFGKLTERDKEQLVSEYMDDPSTLAKNIAKDILDIKIKASGLEITDCSFNFAEKYSD